MRNLLLKSLKILSSLVLISSSAAAQNHKWTKTFGAGSETMLSKAIAIDQTGNVFTVGTFAGTVDFNSGAGVNSLTATGVKDAYILKLDAAGNFLWVKSIGGDAFAGDIVNANSIATDLLGNVIIAGNFSGIVDINTDDGTTNMYTSVGSLPVSAGAGSSDAFILKLNAAGAYLWSQQIGSASGEFAFGITTDISGNIFTTGSFGGASDFDGSASVNNATPVGQSDIYILKLSTNGAFSFVKTMGGNGSDVANAITLDGAGNIYTTGAFSVTSDFDPNAGVANLTSNGNGDIFVSKLNNIGNYVWAKSFGGNVTNNPDIGNAIYVDEQGSVYTTGAFRATQINIPVDFDPGVGVDNKFNVSGGPQDIFISKLDASGNYLWAKTIGSTTNDIGSSISTDAEGNMYVLGSFSGSADFDPDPLIDNIMMPMQTTGGTNSTDLFFVKFDASGTFLAANTIGSNDSDIGYGLVIDGGSNIFITGIFSGVADFDPSATSANFTPVGLKDGFTTKWNLCNNIGALPTSANIKIKQVAGINIPSIYANSNCDILTLITPSGANPVSGNTSAKVWLETVQPNVTNGKYCKRHYEITPTLNPATATAKLTLYFTQQDFDDFNAVSTLDLPNGPTDVSGIANLIIEKKSGSSNNGTGLPASYTGATVNIDPINSDIIWNEGTKRWEVSFNTTGFSGFFVKTQTGALPTLWLNVNGVINKQNQATISWQVQEVNVLKYEIEKSTDCYVFTKFLVVKSTGDGIHTYSILDNVNTTSVVYYRIKQIDYDGRYSYSSIIKLANQISGYLGIFPNPVKDLISIAVTNVLLNTKVNITDLSGKILQSLTIVNINFSLDLTLYPSAIYFLKFENGKSEKIIKL